MLEIGSLVDGKYKILNKVGQGGMSVVYLAMNEKAKKIILGIVEVTNPIICSFFNVTLLSQAPCSPDRT